MENISQSESEEDKYVKRIKMLESILNFYRSRSLTLDHIISSKQAENSIPADVLNEKSLSNTVLELYDEVTFIESLKQCLQLLKNSVSCMELTNSGAVQHRPDITDKIQGIIHFSRVFMQLYENSSTEIEIIEKMKVYSEVMSEYSKSLESLKKCQNEEEMEVVEKANKLVYKINLIRMMKSVLIGFISVTYPDLLKFAEEFRTPMRRNLTVDDFVDNWDIGLPSS